MSELRFYLQPSILYIVDARANLTASTICGVLLESTSCPLDDEEYNWTVNIDNNPGKTVTEKANNKTINIVQITDLHYDPKYEPYGNAVCGKPACCRMGQNDTNVNGILAGFWGDYNSCDTPWHAVVDALNHAKDTHKVGNLLLHFPHISMIHKKCIVILNDQFAGHLLRLFYRRSGRPWCLANDFGRKCTNYQ